MSNISKYWQAGDKITAEDMNRLETNVRNAILKTEEFFDVTSQTRNIATANLMPFWVDDQGIIHEDDISTTHNVGLAHIIPCKANTNYWISVFQKDEKGNNPTSVDGDTTCGLGVTYYDQNGSWIQSTTGNVSVEQLPDEGEDISMADRWIWRIETPAINGKIIPSYLYAYIHFQNVAVPSNFDFQIEEISETNGNLEGPTEYIDPRLYTDLARVEGNLISTQSKPILPKVIGTTLHFVSEQVYNGESS